MPGQRSAASFGRSSELSTPATLRALDSAKTSAG